MTTSPGGERFAAEAARHALEQRAAFEAAVEALRERVEEEAVNVSTAIERAREGLERGERALVEHRWLAVGAAVALGLFFGTRRARRRRREAERLLDAAEDRMLVLVREQPPPRRTRAGELLGTVGGFVARQLASLVADSLVRWQSERVERPVARRSGRVRHDGAPPR